MTEHIFTTSQINAAWEYAKCNHSAETWDSLLTILSAFNIVACDECGGRNYVPNGSGISPCSKRCPSCAERGSNGWRLDDE